MSSRSSLPELGLANQMPQLPALATLKPIAPEHKLAVPQHTHLWAASTGPIHDVSMSAHWTSLPAPHLSCAGKVGLGFRVWGTLPFAHLSAQASHTQLHA